MRKRYQKGSVTKSGDGRYWVGKYREEGNHKTKLLGACKGGNKITKSEARDKLGVCAAERKELGLIGI